MSNNPRFKFVKPDGLKLRLLPFDKTVSFFRVTKNKNTVITNQCVVCGPEAKKKKMHNIRMWGLSDVER